MLKYLVESKLDIYDITVNYMLVFGYMCEIVST